MWFFMRPESTQQNWIDLNDLNDLNSLTSLTIGLNTKPTPSRVGFFYFGILS